jgi:hypothetical protein
MFPFFLCIKLFMWLSILLNPLVFHWILFCCISSYLGSSSCDYIDVSPIIPGFCRDPLDNLIVLVTFFVGYFPRVLDNVLCHGLLRESTYMLQLEVDNPLHNFLVVGNFGALLVLFFIQILLYRILHLCIHLNRLVVCSTEVPSYIAWGYIVDVHILLWLHNVVLLFWIIVWLWYLVEMRCNFSCDCFCLHPISI